MKALKADKQTLFKMINNILFAIQVLLATHAFVTSLPINVPLLPLPPSSHERNLPPSRSLVFGKNLEDYLTKFGYLPQSNLETGAMRTEQHMRDAVKNLQFFAGINVTGEVDQTTVDLMMAPRCGVPDVSHPGISLLDMCKTNMDNTVKHTCTSINKIMLSYHIK